MTTRRTPTSRPGPTMRRRRLGSELRKLREAAGLTIDPVAVHLACSPSKISRIETGRVAAATQDIRRMLDLYEASGDQRRELLQIATLAQEKAWWQAYSDTLVVPLVGLEEAAAAIDIYEAIVVPGLFQTPNYARAIIHSVRPGMPSEQIERLVELRMTRQETLFARDDPPRLSVIIDEAVLHRPIGEPALMDQQLKHLVEVTKQPTVTLRLLPFGAGAHPAMSGAFTIFRFSRPDEPGVVYLEHKARDLYLDDPDDVQRYTETFEKLCRLSFEPNDTIKQLNALKKNL